MALQQHELTEIWPTSAGDPIRQHHRSLGNSQANANCHQLYTVYVRPDR